MPQYAVLIFSADSAHAPDATPEQLAEPDRHARELTAADSMLAAYAFTPRAYAVSIRSEGISEGPFIEAKDAVAGFYVIEADDLDDALAIAGTNPVIQSGGGVEVRPIHSGGPIRAPRE
jgi:hypothetical protein